ncbi:alpha/beta hydrolase family esterase [Streptomyces sp. 4N509B]|uniref:alpha/beta hydrolase family esterase n=1 Tax=Streptomyces sp. 4N509B TaxID=3457413 RepID=UPI003FD4B10E
MSTMRRHTMARRANHRFRLAPLAALAAALGLVTGGQALATGPAATAPPDTRTAAPADDGVLDATAGCGQTPTLRDGTYTIQSSGKNRSFILDVPDTYDSGHPHRLVLGLHWWGGTAEDVATGRTVETGTWAYYGLKRQAGDSTIFVAPQGLDNAWANTGGEDVVFVDDMLAMIEADLCVDTSLRFSIGFSYGGAMSYALACARPDDFRAVVSQSSPGVVSGCAGGTEPVAFMGVHGISDEFGNAHEGQRDTFVRNNGCTPQTPPRAAAGSLTHITTAYQGCAEGYPVVWASFDGNHNPAPRDGASGSGGDTWVPGEAWEFITQFASTSTP